MNEPTNAAAVRYYARRIKRADRAMRESLTAGVYSGAIDFRHERDRAILGALRALINWSRTR